MLEIVVGPDMNDAVELPDFGVEKSAQRRHLDAFCQRLNPPFLDFRHRTRLQCVGPHLEDHRLAPFNSSPRRFYRRTWACQIRHDHGVLRRWRTTPMPSQSSNERRQRRGLRDIAVLTPEQLLNTGAVVAVFGLFTW